MKFFMLTHLVAGSLMPVLDGPKNRPLVALVAGSFIPVLDGPKNRPLVVMVEREVELDEHLRDYVDRECQEGDIQFKWIRLDINFN